jgi:uncharacterized membrane protein
VTLAADNSQSRNAFRALTALVWIAVPVAAVLYALAWNELPPRLATHFNFANQPNGWMSREGSLVFFLIFAALMAGTASFVLSRVTRPDPTAWVLLAFFYIILGVLIWAERCVIAYNVDGRPVNVIPVFGAGMLAAAVLIVIALGTRRGAQFPATAATADELHYSAASAALFGVMTVIAIRLGALAPTFALRFVMTLPALMLLGATALAWSGFHYLFSPAGIEIRTMGFRLRSIPATEIETYTVDRCNWLGGYGIRGVGNRRAYVWGNRGVRIKTTQGELFLGHDNPLKIVRDLDAITHHQHHEVTPGS